MYKCVNCGEPTINKVINSCGHTEYICEECCKTLEDVHLENGEYVCEDKCVECLQK